MSGFRVVSDVAAEPDPPPTAPTPAQQQATAATRLLLTALAALSQRAIVALAALFSLLLAGSAFWLATGVLADPNPLKLTGLGLYCLFILALHLVRRQK